MRIAREGKTVFSFRPSTAMLHGGFSSWVFRNTSARPFWVNIRSESYYVTPSYSHYTCRVLAMRRDCLIASKSIKELYVERHIVLDLKESDSTCDWMCLKESNF